MAVSQSDLDELERAIKQGARTVEYADMKVEYRSLNEMLRTRDWMRRELGRAEAGGRVTPKYSKGLG
ncbi:MAG: phage head-tail joining protein [Thiohalorhabdus sp.]